MDASRLTIAFALVVAAIGLSRFVLGSAGRAGDGLAALFVPPDQSLGWPHGVQEGDEPWAWRAAPPTIDGPAAPTDHDLGGGHPADLAWGDPPPGTFVVPVARVDPVHLGVRPH